MVMNIQLLSLMHVLMFQTPEAVAQSYDPTSDIVQFDKLVANMRENTSGMSYFFSEARRKETEELLHCRAFSEASSMHSFLVALSKRDRSWPDEPVLTVLLLRRGLETGKNTYEAMVTAYHCARSNFLQDGQGRSVKSVWSWVDHKPVLNVQRISLSTGMLRGKFSVSRLSRLTDAIIPTLKFPSVPKHELVPRKGLEPSPPCED